MNALKRGVSWSGREPNRCFLNLGNTRFSDVSAISGLDSKGDGRAAAMVDWDRDGDLDIWLTNRTAPRLTLLRNNIGQEQHFVALKLVGTTSNRDGIGARLKLHLEDSNQRAYIDTVRAGDGFLGQSSKTVHFGLGTDPPSSLRLSVRWPGGVEEEFQLPNIDRVYQITQGGSITDISADRGERIHLAEASFQVDRAAPRRRIWMAHRKALPALQVRRAADELTALASHAPNQPRLVLLWNQTCKPCLGELEEVALQADQINSAGLAVIAVHLNEPRQSSDEERAAADILQRLAFPYEAVVMDHRLQQRVVELLEDRLARHFEFVLPTSFLLDQHDRLAAVYRGPFDLATVMEDVALLEDQESSDLDRATPFIGRWMLSPLAAD